MARSHEVFIVNNSITQNGTQSGSTGGRFGVSREGSTTPERRGFTLLSKARPWIPQTLATSPHKGPRTRSHRKQAAPPQSLSPW